MPDVFWHSLEVHVRGKSASSTAPVVAHSDDDAIDRLPAVKANTGLGTSTIYKEMAASRFPRPIQLTKRAVGWRRGDIRRWLESRSGSAAQ
jgi:prophage regulatory protein